MALERSVDGDRRVDRRRRRAPLPPADGAARARRRRRLLPRAARPAPSAAPPAGAGALRARRAALGGRAWRRRFDGERAPALVAGLAAHSMLRLDERADRRVRPRAGDHRPRGRLAGRARRLAGGRRRARRPTCARSAARSSPGTAVANVDELADARAVLLDVTPRQVLALAGHRLPARYRRALGRYRYGPGVFKLDWALDGPDPVASARVRARGHGAPRRDARRDRRVRGATSRRGRAPRAPVRAARPADGLRSEPRARRQAHGVGLLPRPGRLDARHDRGRSRRRSSASHPASATACSRARRCTPAEMERYNPNYVGGDINGGRQDLRQLFTRPVARVVAVHDARPAALHLLVVDAARRRRPRHVRLLRRARRC